MPRLRTIDFRDASFTATEAQTDDERPEALTALLDTLEDRKADGAGIKHIVLYSCTLESSCDMTDLEGAVDKVTVCDLRIMDDESEVEEEEDYYCDGFDNFASGDFYDDDGFGCPCPHCAEADDWY